MSKQRVVIRVSDRRWNRYPNGHPNDVPPDIGDKVVTQRGDVGLVFNLIGGTEIVPDTRWWRLRVALRKANHKLRAMLIEALRS